MSSFKRSAVYFGLMSILVVGLLFGLTGCGFLGQSPDAKIDPSSPGTISVGETIDFDGGDSEANSGEITDYEWDFGDGSSGTGETISHSYDSQGTYTVELEVTNDSGLTDSTTVTVTVEELTAYFTMDPDPATVDEEVSFDASGSTGDIDNYSWDFKSDSDPDTETASGETAEHTYSDPGEYVVELTIKDSAGNYSTRGETLEVQTDSSTT